MGEENAKTIEQRKNTKRKLLKKLVATARNIIAFEVGVPVGVWKLLRYITWLDMDGIAVNLPILKKYNEATLALPSGKERLNCSRDALRRYDASLNQINLRFHDQIIDACFHIIERYGDVEKFLEDAEN